VRAQRIAALACTLLPALAAAGPADYVYTPTVVRGERELDFKYGAADRSGEPSAQAASLGLGYGATDWWFTEFYLMGSREGARSNFDAIEFESKFQLTETGHYPVDIGFIAEFELPHDRSEGNEFRFGPLFQAELDRFQINFNPLLANVARAVEGNGTYLEYQWQLKHRWQPALEFGAQGFGELGHWDHVAPASGQSHRIGPALFGKAGLGGSEALA
jgi:hypothetical protein